MKKAALGCLGLLGVLCLFGIVVGIMGNGDGGTDSRSTAVAEASAGPQDRKGRPIVNNPATVGGLKYTVESVQERATFESDFSSHRASGEYVVLRLTVANVGDSPADVSASDFQLERGQRTFDVDPQASPMTSGGFFLNKVNPGMRRTGTLVFDVPANTSPFVYRLVVSGNGAAGSEDSVAVSLQ